jgi:hypothetical protein
MERRERRGSEDMRRLPGMIRILAGSVLLVALATRVPPATATENPFCLADEMSLLSLQLTSTASTFDTTSCPYFDCYAVAALMEVDYSWPAGRFFARSFSQQYFSETILRARDRFLCSGISAPTTLTVRASFRGMASGGCVHWGCDGGQWRGGLSAGGSSIDMDPVHEWGTIERTLERTIQVHPGQTFVIELRLITSAWGGQYCCGAEGNVEADLSFPDLPAGAGIRSCKGFASGVPTPTNRKTWGQVKQLYR